MQSFFSKTQEFACKSGVILEFWGVCMRLLKKLGARFLLFKQGFDSFLKTIINAYKTKPSLILIPYIDLSWARDPSLRAFDML